MADVITRFKLETTQWDSKLRDAAKGLKEVVRQAELGGAGFSNFSQKSVEAARALGTIESGANNTKDKLKDLVGSFNDAARAYNNLSQQQQQSDFGKAMSQSLTQLQQRIKETKDELYSLGDATKQMGGGDNGFGGMLQVFGGNILTKLAGFGVQLTSEIGEAINASAQLARQAEGVQIAFNRLGRGDILDGLREATHGTVTDLELMKAAVKFNDFRLPLEELGTMLAFAQQKAKDTGNSVDYMVDSIVTGLGRQSLMILDNLGLSAAEVRDKMKETGDMTKAVGEIIREQMSKAGDYVETAADRATQANVELENQMLQLGNSMRELTGFGGWDEMATKIKSEVVGSLQFTIDTINKAKGAWNSFMQAIGVKDKPKKQPSSPSVPAPNGTYWESTDEQGNVTASGRWLNGKRVQTGAGDVIITGHKRDKTKYPTSTGGGGRNSIANIGQFSIPDIDPESLKWHAKPIEHTSLLEMIGEENLRKYLGMPMGEQTRDWGKELGNKVFANYVNDPDAAKRKPAPTDDPYKFANDFSKIVGGVGNITAGLQTLGVDLPEGFTKTVAAIQTVSGILTAILAITSAIEAAATVDATASTLDAIIPFHNGGMIRRAANGLYVPGTRYSGDTTLIRANAGELILNQSSQGNLAAELSAAQALVGMINSYQSSFMERQQMGNDAAVVSGGVAQSVNRQPYMTGEMIFLGLNTYLESSGRGELMTSRFK